MAVHFWIGRVLSVTLLVLLGLAGTARADHYLTHPAATPQAIAAAAERNAKTLFERGTEVKVKRDANVKITPGNIPKNDRFLKAYSTDRTTAGISVPGLLGIATQAYRTQSAPYTAKKTYSLADAMRDAVWRKQTSAKLKGLMSTQRACGADDTSPALWLGGTC
jgi:hypothetical protein